MPGTILVVEDDQDIADSVAYSLRREGYEVEVAYDGSEGVRVGLEQKPDLVILDLMLPGLSGFGVFRELRRRSTVPVIMLTARVSENDRVAGLELGADDYITKPFSLRELVARVKTVLRRAEQAAGPADEVLTVKGLVIDRGRRTVTVDGRQVTLTPQEFALLECLARHPGRAMSREVLLQQAWSESEYIDPRTVDVHVRLVRGKIEAEPSQPTRILTVRGVGYKLAE
ncbi:MAG TPA: response regulator transcription factor [Armatimonadota bacterium]|nr:response regulator transcription factor [Armatimonadota bacterium]